MNTQMNSMSDEQLARFGQFMVNLFGLKVNDDGTVGHNVIEAMHTFGWSLGQETPKTLAGLGRIVVRLLSNSVAEDGQQLVYTRFNTDNNNLAKQLMMDCVAEFAAHRSPVDEYVARRYDGHDERFRDRKLVSVAERVEIAENVGIEV